LRALRDFVQRENCIAWIEARAPGGWTFGAHRRTAWGMRRCTPDEERAGRAETFNGNCVCVSRAWVERVGLVHDHLFPHGVGDFDYGLRLHAAGARLSALSGVIAESADPARHSTESWLASARPMRAIWRDFSSPKSYLHFPAWRRFALRHWGPVWGRAVFVAPYARWLGIACVRPVWRRFNSPSGRATNRD
jgi:GT2 family glycosyltransferase